jgi:hypothetical protein
MTENAVGHPDGQWTLILCVLREAFASFALKKIV